MSNRRAKVIFIELVFGVSLLAYGGWLIYPPLAYCLPGCILILDAFLGGRE